MTSPGRLLAAMLACSLVVSSALAQEDPAQDVLTRDGLELESAPTGETSAPPASALEKARDKAIRDLELLELRGDRERGEAETKSRAATERADSLMVRLESASTEDRGPIEALIELRRDEARNWQAAASALDEQLASGRQLLAALEARVRAEREGLGAAPVPTTADEVRAALLELEVLEVERDSKRNAVSALTADMELTLQERARVSHERSVATEEQKAAPPDLPALERSLLAARVEAGQARGALANARSGIRLRLKKAAEAELSLAEARVEQRRRTLDEADPRLVEAQSKTLDAEGDAAEAESRRRVDVTAQRTRKRLDRERASAASELEKALARQESASDADARALAEADVANAQRVVRLAELDRTLEELRAEYREERDAWVAREELLADTLDETREGSGDPDAAKALIAETREALARDRERLEAQASLARDADQAAELGLAERRQLGLELEDLEERSGSDRSRGTRRKLDLERRAVELSARLADRTEQLAGLRSKQLLLAQRRIQRQDEFLADDALVRTRWSGFFDEHRRFLIALLATVLASLLARSLLKLAGALTAKTRFQFDEFAVKALAGPVRFAVLVIGLNISVRFLAMTEAWRDRVAHWREALVLAVLTYFVYKLMDVVAHLLTRVVENTETQLDDQLLPVLRRLAKVVVLAVGAVMVLEQLGYPVTSILAGLGLGGLAFALAAKDTVSNLFGSVMIFLDKPFNIGDWIKFGEKEGIVEGIGLRSTRVRTWEDTLYTIPNGQIATGAVENVSRFNSRRVYVKLPVRSDTPPDKLVRAVEIIREVLDDHESVKSGHYVFFNDLTDWGASIMVYYFVKFTAWRVYLQVRQEIFIEILRRFKAEGIQMAFPTQTMILEKGEEKGSGTFSTSLGVEDQARRPERKGT